MKIGKLVLGPDPLQPAPYGNRTIVSARCLSIIYSRISQSTLLSFRLSRANVLCPFFKRIFSFFANRIEGKNRIRFFVGEKKKKKSLSSKRIKKIGNKSLYRLINFLGISSTREILLFYTLISLISIRVRK